MDTRSDYGVVEAAYLTAIAAFAHDAGITHLTIREPGMSRNPSPLGATPQGPALAALFDSGLAGYHDGAQVSVPVALELIRGMLRDSGAWCRLEADEAFLVHIGWDQYVYVGSCEPCERALARTRELGLFTERLTASPYTASFDEPGEQHPADDDFWASVHLATPRDGAMLLEEHYVHNASRRHRLPGTLSWADRESLRAGLAPRALLTVWPGLLSPGIEAVLRTLPDAPGSEYTVTVLREDRAGGITACLVDETQGAELQAHLAGARAAAILPDHTNEDGDAPGCRPLFTAVLPGPDGVLRARWRTQPTPADLRWDRLRRVRRGEIRTGTVTSIESFGVFVDLGDHIGSINAAELSWQRYDHYTDVVQVGQEVTVEILDVDLQRRVTKILPFGAFVLLGATFAGAMEGLVSITELSEEAVRHPEDVLRVGDELTVRILTIDRQRRRISLSLKPDPTTTTDS